MRHIQTFDRSRGLFVEIIDNFFACFLVFLVDVAITYFFSARGSVAPGAPGGPRTRASLNKASLR